MDKKDIIEQIIEIEWPMFHTVNGNDCRVDCQDDYVTFHAMRMGQYSAWNEETLASYLNDVTAVRTAGGNIAREKYIRMMKSSDPQGFEHFKAELPEVSEEKQSLVGAIWEKMLAQTIRMNEKYPVLAMTGRPLYESEDAKGTSIQTYQTSELLTYSENTLRSLLAHIAALEEQGTDFVSAVQENSLKCIGYDSLAQAEKAAAAQLLSAYGATEGCCCCGDE